MSVTIAEKDVLHVAKLANIAINPEEISTYQQQLSSIMTVVAKLQEVNTEGVLPTTSVSGAVMPMRADVVTEGNCRDAVLANTTPLYGCFAVPKVIE
jgi:aspartyl-tRNA(Asn)/glutamyl-tRNA(Gln) amidotransferase subunit C